MGGTGLPATVSVPAAIELAAVIVVLAKVARRQIGAAGMLAPVAAASCGRACVVVVAAAGREAGDQAGRDRGDLQTGGILHVHISCVRAEGRVIGTAPVVADASASLCFS